MHTLTDAAEGVTSWHFELTASGGRKHDLATCRPPPMHEHLGEPHAASLNVWHKAWMPQKKTWLTTCSRPCRQCTIVSRGVVFIASTCWPQLIAP
eukprot:NODE_11659_length_1273_cov_3.132635.p2 GENE.NODE_11659_length_1273_cov_3.132635~~NODE_11659_length_1273_cov_3.132635.p2  ORF type:complete len:95 (-),score=11.23 NODE_11659_length_1273_cov_3.132635:753-1037(-)